MINKIESEVDKINISYKSNFISKASSNRYFNILNNDIQYNSDEESKIEIFGKKISIPRKQVGYGDNGAYYSFSGLKVVAKSWDDDDNVCKMLKDVKKRVEDFTGLKFNFVLINKYENGDQYIGYHRDDEKELGSEPTIVGVSFGAEREIYFKPHKFITHKMKDPTKLKLEHGSVFVMYHPTNTHWKHSIPKKSSVKSTRISLTFRNLSV